MSLRRHILFDLDGTLIDSAAGIVASLERTLALHAVTPVVPLGPQVVGPTLARLLRMVTGIEEAERLETLAASFKRLYAEVGLPLTAPFAGIDAFLRALQAEGRVLHLTTNKRRPPTEQILERLGWSALFATVYAPEGDDAAPPPKSRLMARQLADQGITTTQALYVGDTREDAHAAAENGLRFVGVTWGYGGLAQETQWPVASDLAQLQRLLLSGG